MKITYNKEDKLLIMKITEEIDHHTASRVRSRADFEIEKNMPKTAVFDFEKVTFMDSSGIGMLIGRYKLLSILGGKLYIMNVKKDIKKIFEMSGVLRIIPIIEKIEEVGGSSFEKCIWKWNETRI